MFNTSDKLFEFVPRFKTKVGKLIEETKEIISNKTNKINMIISQGGSNADLRDKIDEIEEKAADYIETIENLNNQSNTKATKEYLKGIIYIVIEFIILILSAPLFLCLVIFQEFLRTMVIYFEIVIFETSFQFSILVNVLILGLLISEYLVVKFAHYISVFVFSLCKSVLQKGRSKFMNIFNVYVPFA